MIFTPDREINPPSFYEKEEKEPELFTCTYCDDEFDINNIIKIKTKFMTMRYYEFRCLNCHKEIEEKAKK